MIFERIEELCQKNNISVWKLEKTLGLSTNSILKWKKSSPTVNKLKLVADYFNVSVDYFL